MLLQEFISQLDEAATDVLYHYTRVWPALQILKSGEFHLTNIMGTKAEQQLAPKDHPYFLSFTRSKTGAYHSRVGNDAVMFVVDGRWLNSRYIVKPLNYWAGFEHTPRESEDRLYSKTSTVPITPVKAIHILLEQRDQFSSPTVRKLLIEAKLKKIPTWLYHDVNSWRTQNTARAINVGQRLDDLRGREPPRYRTSSTRSYLKPWIELLLNPNNKNLSDRAKKLKYDLTYWYARSPSDAMGLETDMFNAKRPGNRDYEYLVKLEKTMRRVGLTTAQDVVKYLSNRLKSKDSVKENIESKPYDLAQLKDMLAAVEEELEAINSASMAYNFNEQQYKALEKDSRALYAIETVIKNNITAINKNLLDKNIFMYDYSGDPGEIAAIHVQLIDNLADVKWMGSYNASGKELFKAAMKQAISKGANRVQLEAKWNSEGFYRKMGLDQGETSKENPFTGSALTKFTGKLESVMEGRDAPLYHSMNIEKAKNVFGRDELQGRWEHTLPLTGKNVKGTSLSRNPRLAFNRETYIVMLELDQRLLAQKYKINTLDADIAVRRRGLKAVQNPSRSRELQVFRYGYGEVSPYEREQTQNMFYGDFAEEFVEGTVRPLHKYIRAIYLRVKNPQQFIDRYFDSIPTLVKYAEENNLPLLTWPSKDNFIPIWHQTQQTKEQAARKWSRGQLNIAAAAEPKF